MSSTIVSDCPKFCEGTVETETERILSGRGEVCKCVSLSWHHLIVVNECHVFPIFFENISCCVEILPWRQVRSGDKKGSYRKICLNIHHQTYACLEKWVLNDDDGGGDYDNDDDGITTYHR